MSDVEIKMANLEGQVSQIGNRLQSIEALGVENSKALVRIDAEQNETRAIALRHSETAWRNHSELSKTISQVEEKLSLAIAKMWEPLNKQQEYINKSIGRDGVVRFIFGGVSGAIITGLVAIAVSKLFG